MAGGQHDANIESTCQHECKTTFPEMEIYWDAFLGPEKRTCPGKRGRRIPLHSNSTPQSC